MKKVFVFYKICFKVKVSKTFETFTDCHIKRCRSPKWRDILKIPRTVFKKNLCSFSWLQNRNSKKKRLRMLRQKPTQLLSEKLLKEATINFYCLFDESRFLDICTIMELKELNWLSKHMKNVRNSQPCIFKNFFIKAKVLVCEYR